MNTQMAAMSALARVRSSSFAGSGSDRHADSGANLSDGRIQFGSTKFSNGAVYFRSTEFSGGTVNFGSSKFSGTTVNFSDARFSGGAVDFRSAEFSGGTVDLSHASDWSDPPIFDSPISPAVELPAAHHGSNPCYNSLYGLKGTRASR